MAFYDTLTQQTTRSTQSILPKRIDNDVKQTALLRAYNSYINKYGNSEGFEEYCRSSQGERHLRKVARYTQIDLFNRSNMKPRNRTKDDDVMTDDSMKRPLYLSTTPTMKLIEEESTSAETNIHQAQRQIEVKDQLHKMYESGDDAKKRAMDLMVEAMHFKEDGQPIPARIRNSMSRLRKEIQQYDPSWKLDLHLL